jgi:Cd2+/Zn2+-exporting ATPase
MQQGKQLCCTQQEKIYTNAGASSLLETGIVKKMDTIIVNIQMMTVTTTKGNDKSFQMFLPAIISFVYYLLPLHLIIIFHNLGLQVG